MNKLDNTGLTANKVSIGGGVLTDNNGSLLWNGESLQNTAPVGSLYWYAGSTLPAGYLICNGSAVSRTTYARLFEAIGTTWGAGDGSTTFNLPNLINRVAWGGSTSGAYKSAGLPNITGQLPGDGMGINTRNMAGVFTQHSASTSGNHIAVVSGNSSYMIKFSAQNSNTIYGRSTTVQPAAATLIPIIKY